MSIYTLIWLKVARVVKTEYNIIIIIKTII